MAFDFGESRIGIAIGNTLLKIPHPLEVVSGHNKFEKFAKIGKLIDEWRPVLLVIGMPGQADNKELLVQSIIRFSNRLKNNFKLPVSFVNEDYTSANAANQLKEQNIYGKAQKTKLDSLAACGILQTYFSSIQDVI
jgi:putative Holliday junction resolvase